MNSNSSEILLIFKPDLLRRKLLGEIITILERKSIYLHTFHSFIWNKKLLHKFYEEQIGKSFFESMVNVMNKQDSIVCLAFSDQINIYNFFTKLKGNVVNPEVGSLRFHYAFNTSENSLHASSSNENFLKEK